MKTTSLICSLFLLLSASCVNETDHIRLTTEQPIVPVLSMKDYNPVMKLRLLNDSGSPYTLDGLSVDLGGTTDIADIESVGLYGSNSKGLIDAEGLIYSSNREGKKVNLYTNYEVTVDTLDLWLSLKLVDKVDLRHRYSVKIGGIRTNDGNVSLRDVEPSKPLRAGVAVRKHNQDNVHTSRIPGLATSKNGTLLAVYDARRDKEGDLQGDIDIALNRSFDGGATWQPMQIVLDMGEWGGLPQKYNGVSDPCVLVDENTGYIYVAGLWMYGVLDDVTGKWVPNLTADSTRWMHQWMGKGSQPGFDVKETSQFLIAKSIDDGATWSNPVNITKLKNREWWLYAPAPGHGITLDDGTLVFPTQGRDKKGEPFSNITWSKDGGATWNVSAPAYNDVTECMAVQLSDSSVMLNMRDNRNRGDSITNGRRVCVTTDLGKTWTEHPTSRKALVEPTCMASIHKHKYMKDGEEKSLLLFVNPESYKSRDHITLKVSYDDGMTWPDDKKVLLDELKGRGYSCVTSVDEETIGILYESSQADLVFQQVSLFEILP